MALRAVQKNNDDPRILSYTKCALFGALVGYSSKYLLPVTSQEKDENFNAAMNKIKAMAKKTELAEIAEIKKIESEAADTFIRLYDNQNINSSELGKIKVTLVDDVMKFLRRVNSAVQEVSEIELKKLKAITKQIRPVSLFVGAGFTIGLLIAVVNNVVNRTLAERALNKQSVNSFD